MMAETEGIIYKGIGGFYTVKTNDGRLLECRPRGIFRKRGEKPVAGDRVRLGQEAGTDTIDAILPRKNLLARPPVANVDQLFIIASTSQPVPSFLVLDKLSAYAIDQEAAPVLVITKPDLAASGPLEAAYASSGIPVVVAHAESGLGIAEITGMLAGKLSVFCGNSGVGKSTLLNAIAPGLGREVGDISRKLGRGRHTTREVEVFEVAGGLLADTPGFASFDLQQAGAILADNLQLDFPEIKSRIGQCKFSSCVHMAEAGCAVRKAVAAGEIAESRYQSYATLYKQAKAYEEQYH